MVLSFFFPAALTLWLGSERGEEPSGGKCPPSDSRSVVMCGVYTDTVHISSSQAPPNFYVGVSPDTRTMPSFAFTMKLAM